MDYSSTVLGPDVSMDTRRTSFPSSDPHQKLKDFVCAKPHAAGAQFTCLCVQKCHWKKQTSSQLPCFRSVQNEMDKTNSGSFLLCKALYCCRPDKYIPEIEPSCDISNRSFSQVTTYPWPEDVLHQTLFSFLIVDRCELSVMWLFGVGATAWTVLHFQLRCIFRHVVLGFQKTQLHLVSFCVHISLWGRPCMSFFWMKTSCLACITTLRRHLIWEPDKCETRSCFYQTDRQQCECKKKIILFWDAIVGQWPFRSIHRMVLPHHPLLMIFVAFWIKIPFAQAVRSQSCGLTNLGSWQEGFNQQCFWCYIQHLTSVIS